eukprot:c30067_g1_i1 orf=70-408(+)
MKMNTRRRASLLQWTVDNHVYNFHHYLLSCFTPPVTERKSASKTFSSFRQSGVEILMGYDFTRERFQGVDGKPPHVCLHIVRDWMKIQLDWNTEEITGTGELSSAQPQLVMT